MTTKVQKIAVMNLLMISVGLIAIAGYYAYTIAKKQHTEKTGQHLSFWSFMNGGVPTPSMKSVWVGMASGVVFGFIDNAGLWFGMSALDPFLPGGALTKAGLGNTFSDFLGSFLGTFIGLIIQMQTGVTNTPIWTEAVGIVIGCLMGIQIPKLLTGKN